MICEQTVKGVFFLFILSSDISFLETPKNSEVTFVTTHNISLQNKNSDFCAPLTSFDWNEVDPNLLGTSSIDTTCTIWGLEVCINWHLMCRISALEVFIVSGSFIAS